MLVAVTLSVAGALGLMSCGESGGEGEEGATSPAAGQQQPSEASSNSKSVFTEAIPAPQEAEVVLEAFERMPDTFEEAAKEDDDSASVRYSLAAGDAGVEALEVRDVYGEDLATEAAVERTAADLDEAIACGRTQPCRRGNTPTGVAMVWGDPAGSILFAAVAPDFTTLTALIDAWIVAADD